jgi:sugar phosphate isomerase/epimerase
MSIKLSFSLLALKNIKEIEPLLKILNKEKIQYIEIPISKFLPGYNIDISKINNLKKLLKKYEIKISSAQAIFFKKKLNIFNLKQKKQTINHLNKIIHICEILNIKNIIFFIRFYCVIL